MKPASSEGSSDEGGYKSTVKFTFSGGIPSRRETMRPGNIAMVLSQWEDEDERGGRGRWADTP